MVPAEDEMHRIRELSTISVILHENRPDLVLGPQDGPQPVVLKPVHVLVGDAQQLARISRRNVVAAPAERQNAQLRRVVGAVGR